MADKKRPFWRWSDFERSDYLFLSISALTLLTLKLNDYGIGLDSAIYASVARHIAEGGNWLSPTYTEFYHTQFAEHPPLALWMPRNLDRRVEVAFPICDPAIQQQVQELWPSFPNLGLMHGEKQQSHRRASRL